ncbi:MAG TPA: ComEC/Rec2 family competence protein [Bryobacteraceae bacterium]|nr:ComEC/Rec2 family competence protein [Bryobacteraceae bacterium]
MRHPLLLPAVCLAAGIAAGRFVDFGSRELVITIAAFLALSIASYIAGSLRLVRLSVWLALLFAGVATELLHRPGPAPEIDAGPREILLLSGCVVQPPVLFPNREQFVLELEPGARVRVNLYQRPGEPPPALRYGQKVELEARLRRPRNFGNPGAFDYTGYLARKQIYWTASAGAKSNLRVLPGECGSRVSRLLFGLRATALERLEQLYAGQPYQTGMMQALLIGEDSKVEESWTDQYRLTGTYHALVISGMHLTALTAIVFLVLRLLPLGELLPLAAATACAWVYTFVTGCQTPLVRAAAGLSLFLAARYLYRRQRLLNLVAAVAIGFLVLDPQQLFEASFQLSFLCVTAIAALAVPILERTSAPLVRGLAGLEDRDRDVRLEPRAAAFRVELRLLSETAALWTRIPERWLARFTAAVLRGVFYFYELAVVSASVQVGLALPMAVYFHRVSFSGLSANMAVVPLLSLVVPAGFLGVFTGWQWAAGLAGWLLALSRNVVDWHASWEPAWRIPDPPLWLGVCLSASLVLLALSSRWRARWSLLSGTAVALLLGMLLAHPFAPRIEPGKLEFTAIDVGQGDAFFIAFPGGQTMLLDAGGFASYGGRPSALDTGEDIVSPYLWTRSIKKLDVVAISHLHQDHAGGIPAVVRNFHPREIWAGDSIDPSELTRLLESVRESPAAVRRLAGGESFGFAGAKISVLAPMPGQASRAKSPDGDSLVWSIRYGRRAVLMTGDMEPRTEAALTAGGQFAGADVLKVPHHGSRRSTGDAMLAGVRPVLALISVGHANSYGHPHPEVLERLAAWRATPLRTDLLGLIRIRTDGVRLELDSGRLP